MAVKRIPLELVQVGMYICKCDRPWIETPFLTHRFLLKNPTQIDKLRQCGVEEVEIDTERGLDVLTIQEELPPSVDDPKDQQRATSQAESCIASLPEVLNGTSLSEQLVGIRQVRRHMMEEIREVLDSIRTSGVVKGSQVKDLSTEILNRTLGHEEAFAALIRTRNFSPDLYDHALNVGTLSVLLGRLLGFEKDRLHALAMGALLHDIGLLGLPTDLLNPAHPLSEAERVLYEQHPQLGADLLKESQGISDEVIQNVAEHHRAFGAQSASGEGPTPVISFSSRLIQVVDEYDDLLTGQGTRSSLPIRDALGELYQKGQRYELDPHLVAHLISQIGIYPLYSLVELNTGERGIVTASTPGQLLRPVVLLIQDSNRHPYAEPMPVNFATRPSDSAPLEIVDVLDAEREGVQVEKILADWVTA